MKQMLLALALMVSGCGLIPDAQTPTEKVAVCYGTVSGLARSTVGQVETDRLTAEQGEEVVHLLEQMNDVCDIAKAAVAGGRPEDAVAYLDAATMVLDKVEDILNGRR